MAQNDNMAAAGMVTHLKATQLSSHIWPLIFLRAGPWTYQVGDPRALNDFLAPNLCPRPLHFSTT